MHDSNNEKARPRKLGVGTRCVHGPTRQSSDAQGSPVVPDIVRSSTFSFNRAQDLESVLRGHRPGHAYTRYENPTVEKAEARLASLEEADEAVLFASGMAAITTTILALCEEGDAIAAAPNLYGTTVQFFERVLPRFGITVHTLEGDTNQSIAGALSRHRPKLVYVETPTNPMLHIVDLRTVSQACKQAGIPVVVDGTFATPVNQRPLALGADLVLHSGSKFLGGHSDLIAGAAACNSTLAAKLRTSRRIYGGVIDPQAAYLLDRGMRTLHVRVERQNENAMALAQFLSHHPQVKSVAYPGLKNHPGHEIAQSQMSGFGALVSFDPDGKRKTSERVMNGLRVATVAASLGGVDTLVSQPATSSHINFDEESLAKRGITPGMIRVSVGIEEAEDLIKDFKNALEN